ncbi:MAG: hypothetical protein FJ144_18065 [Deltaproteobacteria bacterium]|nr:hypothetical protein [Deltaproteobacteria bacterium]
MPAGARAGAGTFWLASALLLLVSLGDASFRGSEDRFAEITREMFVGGDFFHPTINGAPHFYKPLGSYWSIAAASLALGRLDELAARLPSALAGLIALAATVGLGRALFGSVAGRLAGWILLSSYGFLLWSRTAAADMANLAAVVLAVAWFRTREHRPGGLFALVFLLICVAGAQAKGLAAIVVPLAVLAPHLLREARWRTHADARVLVRVLLIALALYVAPFVAAEIARGSPGFGGVPSASAEARSGLAMVFQENVQRFFAPHDHQGPIYTYLFAVPELLLPWSIAFVAALMAMVPAWKRLEPDTRWVVEAIAIVFVVFTTSGSRRSYYILPILPFCALLVGVFLARSPEGLAERSLGWTRLVLRLVAALEVLAPIAAAILWLAGFPVPPKLVLVTTGLGVLGLVLWREGVRPVLARLLGVETWVAPHVAASALLLGGFFCLQYPVLDRFRTEKQFALVLREEARGLAPDRIAFVRHVPALFPFYMDVAAPVRVVRDSRDLEEHLKGGSGIVVASRGALEKLGGPLPEDLWGPADWSEPEPPWDRSGRRRFQAWRFDGAP